ncbi:hypothetical protein GSI_05841 [Ganoderma sinense ZZ0214-1]|uniref:F-box domain-containing protein n=1 Tax=Ganoderma sinense ZZ0214-1 TaxID=1077348 RepID=A0A2G8SBK0_9APHY|nr:hypothetical protein GSI_05841 [Ganoderma sinense ZZ0214-1]
MFPGWDVKPRPLQAVFRRCIATTTFGGSPELTSLAIQNYPVHTNNLRSLPLLEELYLDFRGHTPKPSSRAIWLWDLPQLRSLTVILAELPLTALDKLDRMLTYLHLSSDTPCTGAAFAQLSQLCPVLEHLVFYLQAHSTGAICALFDSVAPLRKLRHLDAWLRGVPDTQAWTSTQPLCGRASLESGRSLLAVTPLPCDLPAICHPSMVAHAETSGTRFMCVRDVRMVQTAYCDPDPADVDVSEGRYVEPERGF